MRFQRNRSQRGSIAALAFVGLMVVLGGITGFAVDSMHVSDERQALQRATDAAALAGAYDLNNYKGTGGLLSQATVFTDGPPNEEPVDFALAVAQSNYVDGRAVKTRGTTDRVEATVGKLVGSGPPYTVTPGGSSPNACQVSARLMVRGVFGLLFSGIGQTAVAINTNSIASAISPMGVPYRGTLYPVAIGYNSPGPDGTPALSTLTENSLLTFRIGANAVWTGTDDPASTSVMNKAQIAYGTPFAGSPVQKGWNLNHPDSLEQVNVGDSISMSTGGHTPCALSLDNLVQGSLLVLPVIENITNPTVKGFILIKYGGPVVAGTSTWKGTITKGYVPGSAGNMTIDAAYTTFLNTAGVQAYKLVQ